MFLLKMDSDEWVFIVQHSKSLHYQIVDCDQLFDPGWVRLLKKLRPLHLLELCSEKMFAAFVMRVLIPFLL